MSTRTTDGSGEPLLLASDRPIAPMKNIGPDSDAELIATLDSSDYATIEIVEAKSGVYAQTIKLGRDHQLRSKQRRKAELEAFQEAGSRIQRLKRGWSPISDRELTPRSTDERERARKARNKRDQRTKRAKPPTPALTRPSLVVTKEVIAGRVACLETWLALPGHRQRHLCGRKADIMRGWIVHQVHIGRHGREPTLTQFAHAFTARFKQPMTRQMAQKRLALLGVLGAAGGPFAVTS